MLSTFAFPLVELHEIPISQWEFLTSVSSQPKRKHNHLVHQSLLPVLSPANLLKVQSVPSSRSLMKMLNTIGSSIDLERTPNDWPSIGLQTLVTITEIQQCN